MWALARNTRKRTSKMSNNIMQLRQHTHQNNDVTAIVLWNGILIMKVLKHICVGSYAIYTGNHVHITLDTCFNGTNMCPMETIGQCSNKIIT